MATVQTPPMELIIRGFGKDGNLQEEKVLTFHAHDKVDTKLIEGCIAAIIWCDKTEETPEKGKKIEGNFMNDWTLNSTIFAELNIQGFYGSRGLGFYRLLAQIDVTTRNVDPVKEICVDNIGGTILVSGKDRQNYFLGYLLREGLDPCITYPDVSKKSLRFEIDLDIRQIDAIETIRLGGDLLFTLNINGLARRKEDGAQTVNVNLTYRANQSTWIEILENMGYRKAILLEIPILDNEISAHFPEAAAYLQTAQTHLLHGHFRDSIGACRDVIESLSLALGDENNQLPETIKSWFEGQRNMSKEERLRLIRRAIKVFTHPARHSDQVSAVIDWGPTDAKATIMMAAALLQMAADAKL